MIEVTDVRKKFGRKQVLDGVTFTVPKGQISALVGVNGTGKTTILNHIMNLTPYDHGSIFIDGERHAPHLYQKISFIPDTPIMLPSMTIDETMTFMADFYDNWNQEHAQQMIKFFRLDPKDKISDLSKGTVAKANLLFGLALDSDYVLMDEPFSGIDIFTRKEISEIFLSYLIKDRGVLITTHEIDEIEMLVDRVIMLDNGKILREFNVEQMREEENKSIEDIMYETFYPDHDELIPYDQPLKDPHERISYDNIHNELKKRGQK